MEVLKIIMKKTKKKLKIIMKNIKKHHKVKKAVEYHLGKNGEL